MFINRYLLGFAKGNEQKIVMACLLHLLLTLLATGVSLCSAIIIRMLQGEESVLFFGSLWQVFTASAALIALRFILSKRKTLVAERCSLDVKASLRTKLLKKLFALGPAGLGKERTGNIVSSMTFKVDYLNEYYTMYLPAAVAAIVNAAGIIAVLARLDLLTALVCVAGCAGMLGCPMVFYFLMRERGDAEMRAHAQYYSDCLDSVQGLPTLKAYNANERQRDLIHQKGEALRRAVMGQLRVTMLENVALQFFAGLGSAFSIAVAAFQCARGAMDGSMLVYALFLIGACFSPMLGLINAWHMGYRGVVASYSIVELLAAPVRFSLEAPIDGHEDTDFDGDICFDHVSFAYNAADGDVLHDISFTIPNHTVTALVGASGSGKSTIAQLLAGFYPVERGRITVDGTQIDKRSVARVQDLISAVWQDSRLFYGTVEENIRVGRPRATHDEVVSAARKASLHDFIVALPDGYDTLIGEQGMRFSGGERQRIALARAFLRDAPIVILDEATSSLDRKNEIEIQHSLRDISAGRTALIIAHRLATIETADQIIIMEKGRISDIGTHKQLLVTSERYRALMGSQLRGGESA